MGLVSGLLNQKLTTIYSTTKDRYGDTTNTTEYTNVPCRFIKKLQVIVDKNVEGKKRLLSEDIQSAAEIWLSADYDDVVENWQVVYDSETYIIQAVEKRYDLSGNLDHIKLWAL